MSEPSPIAPSIIHFPPELPVSQRREDIARAIADNQVVIVAGATGSGKTTQLPKICLELGRTRIGHTQPRRIAARTIAERIAEELGSELGGLVGYQVRFTDRVGADTKIKLMTDGILLNEIHRDRLLNKYDTIIIDEAHERSLTIDFLLGYLKQLLPRRPDLKVIITSATIDPESFSRHFGGAPIVEVSGRTYPVEIRYRPLNPLPELTPVPELVEGDDPDVGPSTSSGTGTNAATGGADRDYLDGINAGLDELAGESQGDVLVFLSGESEIRDAADALNGRIAAGSLSAGTQVLPLYGRLSAVDQHRVFEPSTAARGRRIVLATNVAETSLTVPGIKYVIDAGTARISRYSTRAKIQRLPIEAISQASANQRSGRSGRTSDGIAIRLYSEADFERRPEYTDPEILRTNLAAVILQMISLGLGDIDAFPFLQPPDPRGIKDGLDLLSELGAVALRPAQGPVIAKIGRDLARLPLDPRLARMIVESRIHGVTREVLAITAGLTIQDPRERPLDKRAQADQQHARFVDPTSDFLTLLNLWNYLQDREKELSGNQFRRLCKAEYLNFLRIREWADLYRQLARAAKELRLPIGEPSVNPDGIHKSLLAGLLSRIGIRDASTGSAQAPSSGHATGSAQASSKGNYIGARQSRFVIFPGSALFKKQPAAVMSAELVETSRLFARMNAAIDPAWAEPIAGDLVKRTYGEPHWEKRQGSAVAIERATLYGVPIVVNRRVQFTRIDPAWARELFIRHALVDGDWDSERIDKRLTAFDRHNRALREELAGLEERSRRRDILYDDEAIFEFYDARIPSDVATTRGFEAWWRQELKARPDLLTMTRESLAGETTIDEDAFPAQWHQGEQTLALSYRFEPGAEDDGVTVRVPLALLASLKPAGFDWLVPGLREELVTALIKTLPKTIRRNVVPAADWARRLIAELPSPVPEAGSVPEPGSLPESGSLPEPGSVPEPVEGSLTQYLAETIQRLTYTPVDPSDFEVERLPGHLRMTFSIIGAGDEEVARSKDLVALQGKLKSRGREAVAKASASTPHAMERDGLTTWDFGDLPKTIDTRQGGTIIRAYPALVDRGASVSLRLMSTAADQARETPDGVRRLVLLNTPSPLSYVREHLSQNEKLLLATSPYQNVQALFEDCLVACVDAGIRSTVPDGLVWNAAEFEAARLAVSASIMDDLYATVAVVSRILGAARDADRAIRAATSMSLVSALADAREQLAGLVFPGFISRTGTTQLRQVPRYLEAIASRVDKLPTDLARDRTWMTTVQASTAAYLAAGGEIPLAPHTPEKLVRVRWMLEELRVSLFAQHLPTAESVSPQRIARAVALA